VFDSGLGGLTVVRALREHLPFVEIVYFGDTARVPYGSKSEGTVRRFTREICGFLLDLRPKVIVAACHTVSAVALPAVRRELPVPILGVVRPAAAEVARVAGRKLVAVLGTEATIASRAFEHAIQALNPAIRVVQKPCPLFVPLVEEGRSPDDALIRLAIEEYLAPIKRLGPDAVLLGCTHYPVLRGPLGDYFGPGVELVDCGHAVARELKRQLARRRLTSPANAPGTLHCYVSDCAPRFAALGERFAGLPIRHFIRAQAEGWDRRQASPARLRRPAGQPGVSEIHESPRLRQGA
jgi:glutamate racemase